MKYARSPELNEISFIWSHRMSWNDQKHFRCRRCCVKTVPDLLLNRQWQINRSTRFVVRHRPFRPLPTIRQRFTIKICYIIAHYSTRSHGWRPLHSIKVNNHRHPMAVLAPPSITVHPLATKIYYGSAVWCPSLSYRVDQMHQRQPQPLPIWISHSISIICTIIICSCDQAFHRWATSTHVWNVKKCSQHHTDLKCIRGDRIMGNVSVFFILIIIGWNSSKLFFSFFLVSTGPFACEMCNKTFGHEVSLSQHR